MTCGGTQSNHCRATAAAARTLGLGSFLLLRDKAPDRLMTEEYPGLDGNLIYNRLVGAQLVLLSREEYAAYGSEAMLQVAALLRSSQSYSALHASSLTSLRCTVGGRSLGLC